MGRPKGAKSKSTLEREAKERLEFEKRVAAAAAKKKRPTSIADVETIGDAKELIGGPPAKLMKEIGFEFTRVFAGMAAFVQPRGKGTDGKDRNPNADPRLFLEYAKIAMTGAKEFAQYESPKLSAVMVGQQVVNKILVEGGMPDEFMPPVENATFQPGDIVSAEDGVADAKVVNGEIMPLKIVSGS